MKLTDKKYIDKDKLLEEIERMRGRVKRLRYAVDANCIVTIRNACECLESSIDLLVNSINTLEVKEVEESTDAFIEKACLWLSNIPIEDMTYKYNDFDTSEDWYKFIKDFKDYMKGE